MVFLWQSSGQSSALSSNIPMTRLLFVNHAGRLSGPARSLLYLFKYIRTDYDVAVVMPDGGEFVSVLQQEGIPCRVFPFRHRYIPALAWLIWRGNFDLVYGNNFSGASWRALVAAKLAGRPFVWHIREVFPEEHDKPGVFRRVRHADAIIAVSEASARSVKRYVPEKEVAVVYNGVETGDFAIARDEARSYVHRTLGIADENVLVISLGHICPRKNQQQAVETAAQVTRDYPSVTFCFLGMLDHSPEYTAALKEQIARLGIEDNIRLPGFQRNAAIYLRGADILLHTPSKDPHPRSVVESMAAELPVVAYDVDGVSETVVSGQTGYLVPLGDVTAIAQAVGELVVNPSLRRRMGECGRERVEAMFTAERTAWQVNAVIDRVLQR